MKPRSLALLLAASLPTLGLAGCQTTEGDGYGYSSVTYEEDYYYGGGPVYDGGVLVRRPPRDGRRWNPPPRDDRRWNPPPRRDDRRWNPPPQVDRRWNPPPRGERTAPGRAPDPNGSPGAPPWRPIESR